MLDCSKRQLGEIGIFRNIVFHDNKLDHAALNGRPCLILSETNDKIYIAPFSKNKPKKKYRLYRIPVPQGKIIHDPGYPFINSSEYVSFEDILERDLWGYYSVGQIENETYYNLITRLLNLDLSKCKNSAENLEKIRADLVEQQNYLRKKLK